MLQVAPVESNPRLVRESNSRAILNTDVTALEAYKQKRARDQKHNAIAEKWDEVVGEVAQIRTMLSSILNKLEKIENK